MHFRIFVLFDYLHDMVQFKLLKTVCFLETHIGPSTGTAGLLMFKVKIGVLRPVHT